VVPLTDFTRSRLPVPISRVLREDRMIMDLKSKDVESVVDDLCEPFARKTLLLDFHELKKRMLAREKLLSTGIGRGIAIPHPRDPMPTLREPAVIIFGRSSKGVDYKAVDRNPVHLFFMLVCQNIELHLHLLGALARLLQEESVPDACMKAKGPEDIMRVVMELETKQILSEPAPAAQS
jgi:mannitol/fructose-specific phosphotransferase system IIA component (Ntr-type)